MYNLKGLKKEFNITCNAIISNRFDLDTKVILFDYYDSLIDILEKNSKHEIITSVDFIFDENYYDLLEERSNYYWKKFINNFIKNKEFHNSFFYELLNNLDEEVIVDDNEIKLSYKEFIDILNLFMNSINQGELFNKVYKSGSIYFSENLYDDSMGFTLFNPLNKNSCIFVENSKFNINSLITSCHEFGHCFDLDNFNLSSKVYNKYFFISLYGEVISKLFERLFLRFLLREGIYKDSVKSHFMGFEMDNRDLLTYAFYISTLSDDRLLYILNMKDEYNISDEFDGKDIGDNNLDIIKGLNHVNIKDAYSYVYGDILSMFLAEDIERDGFSLKTLKEFMNNRINSFDENYILESGYTPYEYVKLCDKELQLIKK